MTLLLLLSFLLVLREFVLDEMRKERKGEKYFFCVDFFGKSGARHCAQSMRQILCIRRGMYYMYKNFNNTKIPMLFLE